MLLAKKVCVPEVAFVPEKSAGSGDDEPVQAVVFEVVQVTTVEKTELLCDLKMVIVGLFEGVVVGVTLGVGETVAGVEAVAGVAVGLVVPKAEKVGLGVVATGALVLKLFKAFLNLAFVVKTMYLLQLAIF